MAPKYPKYPTKRRKVVGGAPPPVQSEQPINHHDSHSFVHVRTHASGRPTSHTHAPAHANGSMPAQVGLALPRISSMLYEPRCVAAPTDHEGSPLGYMRTRHGSDMSMQQQSVNGRRPSTQHYDDDRRHRGSDEYQYALQRELDSMQDIDQFFVRDHQDAMTLKSESFPVSAPSPSDHMLVTPQAPIKNSRYLREIDRRIILSRIERGEKQAALAKEYQVSRAAICNLKKHRDEVMSRTDENPLAKHPKKPRPRVPQPRNSRSTRDSDDESGVHELKTRSMALLLTTLRNKNTSLIEFRRCAERILRLLVEEALAIAPIKKVEVWMNDDEKMKGFGMEQPPCAISMEQNGCPLLDIFHLVEPEQPTGYVRIDANEEEAARRITILDAHLPASLNNHSVLIFDVASTCPKAVLTVIQRLLSRGAVAKSIFLVTLFVYPDVIAMVHTNHPTVQIVTAQIDPTLLQPAKVAAADGNAPRISRLALFLRRLADAYHSNDATAYRVGDATDSSEPPQSTASVAIHDHDPRNWETPISEV